MSLFYSIAWRHSLVLLLTVGVYWPYITLPFHVDQYTTIVAIAEHAPAPLSNFLFGMTLEHVIPIQRAWLYLEFTFFGTGVLGYRLAQLTIHCIAGTLLLAIAYRIFASSTVAVFAGILFLISWTQSGAVLYLVNCGQIIASIAMLLLLHSVQSLLGCKQLASRRACLVCLGIAGSAFAMSCSFTIGVELIPIAFGWVLLQDHTNTRWRRATVASMAVTTAVLLYFFLRHTLQPAAPSLFDGIGGFSAFWTRLPNAIFAVAYGSILYFAGSIVGTIALHELYRPFNALLTLWVLFLTGTIRPIRQSLATNWKPAFFFAGCALLLYLPPALARHELGFRYFLERSRYCYIPWVFVVLAVSTVVEGVLRNDKVTFRIHATHCRTPLMGLIVMVMIISLAAVRRVHFDAARFSHDVTSFAARRETFLNDLSAKTTQFRDKVIIVDARLGFYPDSVGRWGVSPKSLCTLYRPGTGCLESIAGDTNAETRIPSYTIEKKSGRLLPVE